MKISEASLSAVCAVVILFSLPMFIYALIFGVDFVGALVILFSLTFVLGLIVFIFSYICLIPLIVVFKKLSKTASFIIFIALGFFIPIIFELGLLPSILVRSLQQSGSPQNIELLLSLLRLGAIGLFASFGSWLYLYSHSKPPNNTP